MRTDNIFKVGSVVERESLIGYEIEYQKLRRAILDNHGNLSFVGLHRMGKTSLLKKLIKEVKQLSEEAITVFVNMAELVPFKEKSLFDSLLLFIADEIQEKLFRRLSLEDYPDLCFVIKKFKQAVAGGGMSFRNSFKEMLEKIKDLNLHVFIILDEFDSAETIFESNADYELFRTLADPDYAVSLVFISRRRLYMIEKKNENNSTFHAAFPERPLRGFTEKDSILFFEVLKNDYEIDLPPNQKKRLHYYAGCSPYIYSAFCHELVEKKFSGQNSFDIDDIYKNDLVSRLTDYAKDLFERLQNDGHLSKLLGVLFGPSINITPSDIDLLFFMGYLNEDLNNGDDYQALSGYFTDYLHNIHYVDDSWHNLISLEKQMKKLILDAFPSFEESDWQNTMCNAYQELFGASKTFNYSLYKNFIDNNLKTFNQKSTLLDVMSLSDVFVLIQFRWEDTFKKYFGKKIFSTLEEKFNLCAMARNPLAHGHEEYLSKLQTEQVNVCCKEILDIVKQNQNEEKKPASISQNESIVSKENIGKIGVLTEITPNKNRGIKGKIFNAKGTVQRIFLQHPPEYYCGGNLEVKVTSLNPQGNAYLLQPIETND